MIKKTTFSMLLVMTMASKSIFAVVDDSILMDDEDSVKNAKSQSLSANSIHDEKNEDESHITKSIPRSLLTDLTRDEKNLPSLLAIGDAQVKLKEAFNQLIVETIIGNQPDLVSCLNVLKRLDVYPTERVQKNILFPAYESCGLFQKDFDVLCDKKEASKEYESTVIKALKLEGGGNDGVYNVYPGFPKINDRIKDACEKMMANFDNFTQILFGGYASLSTGDEDPVKNAKSQDLSTNAIHDEKIEARSPVTKSKSQCLLEGLTCDEKSLPILLSIGDAQVQLKEKLNQLIVTTIINNQPDLVSRLNILKRLGVDSVECVQKNMLLSLYRSSGLLQNDFDALRYSNQACKDYRWVIIRALEGEKNVRHSVYSRSPSLNDQLKDAGKKMLANFDNFTQMLIGMDLEDAMNSKEAAKNK